MSSTVQRLPALPSETGTNYCMYYIEDGPTGVNQTAAMKQCCSPNTVNKPTQNAAWCELPDRFYIEGDDSPGVAGWVWGNFTQCLKDTNLTTEIGANTCHLPYYNENLGAATTLATSLPLALAPWLIIAFIFCR